MGDLNGKMGTCHHCKERHQLVELSEDTHEQINYYGVESLQEVDQALYEGIPLCSECYEKEGGIC